MAKKKKNKQPAKKRDRGTPLTLNGNFPIVKKECEEIVKENLINGEIKSYINGICEIIFSENGVEKIIEYKINNKFLAFIKDIKFQKKYNKKERKDIVTNVYYNFLMPQDTYNKIKNLDIDNLYLRINKFSYCEVIKDKDELKFFYKNSYCINSIDIYISKYINAIEKLNKYFLNIKSFLLTNSWRLAIGLGTTSIYETSITLHHIYGIPYIPASAIKGSFRSYIINKYFENELEKYDEKRYDKFEEEILFKDDGFIDIFGSNERKGKIIFFDSFSTNPKIEKDIMNVHYKDYYGDKKPPTDTQSPNPIKFLTIKESEFKFFIASNNNEEIEKGKFKDKNILDFVKNELMKSLEVFGIGAKTAVGYGYFQK